MPLTPESKADLLLNPRIAKWVSNYPMRRHEVDMAIQKLSEHEDMNSSAEAIDSICSAADAICNGVRIFVSYKIGRNSAAKNLLKPFSLFGNGRILFDEDDNTKWPFLCELAGLQGRPYKDEIHAAFEKTHWFFLLLPDVSVDRGWVMFEAGFFRGSMQPGDRLICIHHSTIEPAGPLGDFESVEATHDKILSLFRTLLREPGISVPGMNAINPHLTDEALEEHVSNLVKEIQPTPALKRRYYVSYIDVKLDQSRPIKTRDDLLNAEVVSGLHLNDMFGSALIEDKGSRGT